MSSGPLRTSLPRRSLRVRRLLPLSQLRVLPRPQHLSQSLRTRCAAAIALPYHKGRPDDLILIKG
jgi:hypothetical protein